MKKRRIFPLILLLSLVMSMFAPAALALEVPQLNGQAAVLVDLKRWTPGASVSTR